VTSPQHSQDPHHGQDPQRLSQGSPSQTALTAAAARAAHLIVDHDPRIFADTLAYRLLGAQAEEFVGYHRSHGDHPILYGARAAVTVRSRYTEDRLAAAIRHGTAQYLILGAGLDSFGYRSDLAGPVRVFEVDHPATQEWKRQLLAGAGIAVPEQVTFVPVDFEADPLAGRLTAAGFDPSRPALVSWLGVTMYLTREAIEQTLAVLGGFAPGTELVLDYMLPEDQRDEAGQAYVDQVGAVSAERGEPWRTFLDPGELTALLTRYGFAVVEQVRQHDAVAAELWDRTDPVRSAGLSMLAHARVHE
jgi:methyltransferase (TIGR00027 family)